MTGRDPMPVMGLKGLEKPAPGARSARSRDDAGLAAQVRALAAGGDLPAARDRFAEIVRKHQRRASQIAFHYLRDVADADEATQDAFVKAFVHIGSFRPEHSFEVWFTRILVNGCLDRKRARYRRERWLLPVLDNQGDVTLVDLAVSPTANPEQALLAREQRAEIARAVRRLPPQQRTVFLLCVCGGHSTREAAAITDLSESTVRVHLFRAVRKLRTALKAGAHVG